MQRTRSFLFFSSWGLTLLVPPFFLASFFFSPSSFVVGSCNLEDQGWVFDLIFSSQVLIFEYLEVTCDGNCRRGNPTMMSKTPISSSLKVAFWEWRHNLCILTLDVFSPEEHFLSTAGTVTFACYLEGKDYIRRKCKIIETNWVILPNFGWNKIGPLQCLGLKQEVIAGRHYKMSTNWATAFKAKVWT